MKNTTTKRTNHKVMAAITTACPIAIFFLVMSIKLIIEERYYESTPFIILFIFFSTCIFFVFYNPEIQSAKRIARRIVKSSPRAIGDFMIIYGSKDPIEISHIKDVLEHNDIGCYIVDENVSSMMKFLPEVEIKILVHKDDFEKSMSIVSEMLEQVAQEKEKDI